MSQLLGRQDCIENLRRDLFDIQGAIVDVFSRIGPVRIPSWKFPDKLSCNLDVVSLLEQYDFIEGEISYNQHSHVILLELVIDSFNTYIEHLRGKDRRETKHKGCLSVGLVARKYWSNLAQFASIKDICRDITQQLKKSECEGTERPVTSQTTSRSDFCSSSAWSSTSTLKSLPQNHHLPSSPTNSTTSYLTADRHNVSCQTVKSSLVPCDACHAVQSSLKMTGDALVDLFQSEGLPSSFQPLLAAVEDTKALGDMTADEVAQWANQQVKDMHHLKKHLEDVQSTVQPLKERLATTETERQRFRTQLDRTQKEFKHEIEKHQAHIVQLEFSLQKAERSIKETEQRLQRQLKRETLSLEDYNFKLKETLESQQDTIQTIEHEKYMLEEKVMNLEIEVETCCELQHRIQQLEKNISDTHLLLDKESAKYQSAWRQQESMQAKQKSLLNRVDALDEECNELQRQLAETEEAKINLHTQLQQIWEEKKLLQTQLTQKQESCSELQKEKRALEADIDELKSCMAELEKYVQALKERERLLMVFPELTSHTQAQPQTIGNMLLDMEQHLQANNIRINILEQENAMLLRSIKKLEDRAEQHAKKEGLSQQTWSETPRENPNTLTLVEKSPLQSSSAAQRGYSNRGSEARDQRVKDLGSASSGGCVAASPASMQIYLPPLHLNTGATVEERHRKIHSAPSLSQRKKLNHGDGNGCK